MDLEPPSHLLLITALPEIWSVIGILVLLLFSALISGAEIAFFSLSSHDLTPSDGAQPSKKMTLVAELLDTPKRLLATILIANNLINIAIVLLFDMMGSWLFSGITNSALLFALKVVVVTFMILLFGEILPKIYASRNKVRFSEFMAIPIRILFSIFAPISLPMRNITVFLEQQFSTQKPGISVDQLSQALELTRSDDTSHDEQKLLQGIVTFGATDTKNVMRPRLDVFALDVALNYKEIMPLILAHGYSRIPVYKESMDDIVGILYVKDLLPYFDRKTFDWVPLLRDPILFRKTKNSTICSMSLRK